MATKKKRLIIIGVFLVALLGYFLIFRPSNDRNWSPDQKILPQITIDDQKVRIKNIRNIHYRSTHDFDLNYYDKTFDLKKMKSVWYMVEQFKVWDGMAHTLVSFEFEGPDYVSISAEIRKEEGEKYSVTKGLFRQFELMFVIADENDVIKLRTNHRKHDVYLYPIKVSKEHAQKLFLRLIQRAKKLEQRPEFYNSILNTCTTNIVSEVRKIAPRSIPRSLKVLMPGYSGELAYELGLIDNSLSFEEAQKNTSLAIARCHGKTASLFLQRFETPPHKFIPPLALRPVFDF